jgi:hypothetical protein
MTPNDWEYRRKAKRNMPTQPRRTIHLGPKVYQPSLDSSKNHPASPPRDNP